LNHRPLACFRRRLCLRHRQLDGLRRRPRFQLDHKTKFFRLSRQRQFYAGIRLFIAAKHCAEFHHQWRQQHRSHLKAGKHRDFTNLLVIFHFLSGKMIYFKKLATSFLK
jgi:hypothetical protein